MLKPIKLPEWGPERLREIFLKIEEAINLRSPLHGEGIELEERPDGVRICVKQPGGTNATEEAATGGGAASGTTIDIVGAFNGDPATYHLKQSSAPTPL